MIFKKYITGTLLKVYVLIKYSVGGNDLEKYPVHLVENEYEQLVRDVRDLAPYSHIVISQVPRRRFNKRLNDNIDRLNAFLARLANSSDGVSCIDIRPVFPSMFGKDRVHFNKAGKEYYGNRLAGELLNFQAMSLKNLHM